MKKIFKHIIDFLKGGAKEVIGINTATQNNPKVTLSHSEASFLGRTINAYINNNVDNIMDVRQGFIKKLNKELEELDFQRKCPENIRSFANDRFNKYLQPKVLNSNLLSKKEKKKLYKIWIQKNLTLDLTYILDILEINFTRK